MCLAVPGCVIELRGDRALVEFQGNRAEVSCVLTPEAVVGDWVLVHAGFAIARVEAQAAYETWSYLDRMPADERADVLAEGGIADGS